MRNLVSIIRIWDQRNLISQGRFLLENTDFSVEPTCNQVSNRLFASGHNIRLQTVKVHYTEWCFFIFKSKLKLTETNTNCPVEWWMCCCCCCFSKFWKKEHCVCLSFSKCAVHSDICTAKKYQQPGYMESRSTTTKPGYLRACKCCQWI